MEACLKDLIATEAHELQVRRGRAGERRLRDETDDFAAGDGHVMPGGLGRDGVEDLPNRRLFEVRQVHRDLRRGAAGEWHSQGFDERQAAAALADGLHARNSHHPHSRHRELDYCAGRGALPPRNRVHPF